MCSSLSQKSNVLAVLFKPKRKPSIRWRRPWRFYPKGELTIVTKSISKIFQGTHYILNCNRSIKKYKMSMTC